MSVVLWQLTVKLHHCVTFVTQAMLYYYFFFSSLLVVRRRNDELVMWTICYRASTSSVASSCSSSVSTSVVGGLPVSTTVSSTVSNSAYNVSTFAGRISPSLLDDSSTSSACQASTPQSDKLVHHPKKVFAQLVCWSNPMLITHSRHSWICNRNFILSSLSFLWICGYALKSCMAY